MTTIRKINDRLDSVMTSEWAKANPQIIAIAHYVFLRCKRPDDFSITGPGNFGGWHRLKYNPENQPEAVWRIIKSTCTPEFLKLLKERCPWVRID